MAGSVKPCERCGKHYHRPRGLSADQWAGRRFCSKQCGGMRRLVGNTEVVGLYAKYSSEEIGGIVGLSGTHIRRILRDEGVALRDASEGKKLSHSRPEVKRKLSVAAAGRRLPEAAKAALRDRTGSKHHSWKCGLTQSGGGYLQFTASPANGEHAGQTLHRVVAEWKIGRPIREGEHVHHVDGNKLNNDPANLEVMSASDHNRLHAQQNRFWKKKSA